MSDFKCFNCDNVVDINTEECSSCHAPIALTKAEYYFNGIEVEQDYKKALELYESLKDDSYALYNAGYCYYEGLGTNQDYKKAFDYFKKSYEMGDITSAYLYGNCYLEGLGTTKDVKKGLEILKSGAVNEDSFCCLILAKFYLDEESSYLDKNKRYQEAFNYLEEGSVLGDDSCMYYLGKAYEEGIIITKDINEAILWYKEATELNNQEAIEALERLRGK